MVKRLPELLKGLGWFILAILILGGIYITYRAQRGVIKVSSSNEKSASDILAQSEIRRFTLPFTDKENREVLVYVPKGFSDTGLKRYPVIYLLHGSPGLPEDWFSQGNGQKEFDRAIESKAIEPFIAVLPDGNGSWFKDTQFIDAPDGSLPNQTFIVKTVVNYIDTHYPTRAEAKYRAIGGISSGAYGAINIGLRHQDVYNYALSFSGYGDIEQNPLSKAVIQNSKDAIRENSPNKYLSGIKTKNIKIWMMAGDKDDLLGETKKLSKNLKAANIDTTLVIGQGHHGWALWEPHFHEALAWLGNFWFQSL